MKLPEVTTEQFLASIPAMQHVALQAGACEPFLNSMANRSTPSGMASLLQEFANEIAGKLGAFNERRLHSDRVLEWLQENPFTESTMFNLMIDHYSREEMTSMLIKVLCADSMINQMKLELFSEIILDVSLAEIEQLYIAHRPHSYEAHKQLKIAV